MDQARAYAMANNDYVYVGFQEVNVAVGDTVVPQQAATSTVGGRVAVAIVASKDGTPTLKSANLYALQKVARFDNLHLADFTNMTASAGPMSARALIDGITSLSVGSPTFASTQSPAPTFSWPLQATTAQYQFTKIIQYDSQGVASIPGVSTIPQYIEVALQQTHGNSIPALPANLSSGNQIAIQTDGITGFLHIYRP
jgi:hypothetical protein